MNAGRVKASRLAPNAIGLIAMATTTLVAETAFGFCRTTTCDPEKEICREDADKCLIDGIPLFWPDLCVTFGVHADGSPKRGISFTKAEEVTRRAFQTWISADCGGGLPPSIGVVSRGEVFCDRIEYNHNSPPTAEEKKIAGPNANIVVFRDEVWPYVDVKKTIALTTITFNVNTGEILDADIEVNSSDVELTTGDVNVRNDLQSVMTHEVGHFFGLAHSLVPGASMNEDYDNGNIDFRSLSEDDRQGICALYPPGEAEILDCQGEEPRYGFSRYCGENVLADGCNISQIGQDLERSEEPPPPPARRPRAAPLPEPEAPPSRVGQAASWGIGLLALGLGLVLRRRRQTSS